jgi:hypothetical protein
MNAPNEDTRAMQAGREVENTLRLVAGLPAPEGLEDRIQQALREAPRSARILSWPLSREGWAHSAFARGAAAAAIVFVVGGGGWGVYSRVHPPQAPKVIAMPRIAAPGGFSSAGAMRTPQTLNRPVLAHPVVPPQEHATTPPQKHASAAGKTHKTGKSAKTAQSAQ